MVNAIKVYIEASRAAHSANIEQHHVNWAWHLKSRPM